MVDPLKRPLPYEEGLLDLDPFESTSAFYDDKQVTKQAPPKPTGLAAVFSADTMASTQPQKQQADAENNTVGFWGWLSWIASFFVTPSTTSPAQKTENTTTNGVDNTRPKLQEPNNVERQHLEKLAKAMKTANEQRKDSLEYNEESANAYIEFMKVMLMAVSVKESVTQTNQKIVVGKHEHHKITKQQLKQLLDKVIENAWKHKWLSIAETVIGFGTFCAAVSSLVTAGTTGTIAAVGLGILNAGLAGTQCVVNHQHNDTMSKATLLHHQEKAQHSTIRGEMGLLSGDLKDMKNLHKLIVDGAENDHNTKTSILSKLK